MNGLYQMHPFVADDDEEHKEGWVFLDELPDWWQSMSFVFLLFCEEQPEEIQFTLSKWGNENEDGVDTIVTATKISDCQYKHGNLRLELVPYNAVRTYARSAHDFTKHPFYVGKHDFPKDKQAFWSVSVNGYDLEKLFNEGLIFGGIPCDKTIMS